MFATAMEGWAEKMFSKDMDQPNGKNKKSNAGQKWVFSAAAMVQRTMMDLRLAMK